MALYRLWLGTTPDDLQEVVKGQGDGKWGTKDAGFYLAEGDDSALAPYLRAAQSGASSPLEVRPTPIPKPVIRALDRLWNE